MKKPLFFGLIIFLLCETGVFAQNAGQNADQTDEKSAIPAPGQNGSTQVVPSDVNMEQILREALTLRIRASLFHDKEQVMWQSEVEKLTIPGRPVTVNLRNDQARLSVHFTPYRKDTGGLILVAHTEIWLVEDNDSRSLRYFTSMKSIPLEYGEIILFYPLGKLENLENPDQMHIEIGLSISPYSLGEGQVTADVAEPASAAEN